MASGFFKKGPGRFLDIGMAIEMEPPADAVEEVWSSKWVTIKDGREAPGGVAQLVRAGDS